MQDFNDGLRQLTHRPGFSIAVVLTLALGIGANTLVFSVVHSVLLTPLPFPDAERLVTVWQTQPGNSTRRVAPGNFLDWRAATSFEGLAAYDPRRRSLAGDEPERITVATVSSNFFSVLGVQATVGRTFGAPIPPGAVREVVLRDDLWRHRFGADLSLVGRTIQLDDETVVVAGVIPARLAFPEEAVAWTQAPHDVPEITVTAGADLRAVRDSRYFRVIGRLRTGVSRPQAQNEMDGIAKRLRDAYPDANADTGVNIVGLLESVTVGAATTLWVLLAVVGCLLAIACANVGTLLMAGTLGRVRELQVRAALGASRWRLMRQLLVESLVLAALGAATGTTAAWVCRPALVALLPEGTPRLDTIGIDAGVIAFTFAVALLTTLAFGSLPAMAAARYAGISGLRDGARSTSPRAGRLGSILMAAQLALAVVLVTGTGLMARTLSAIYQRDPGIDIERLLALDVTIPDARARGRAAAADAIQRMVDRIGTLPDVTGAGAIQALPLSARGPSANIRLADRVFPPNEAPDVSWRAVTPDYFQAAGITIVRGRRFTHADREGTPPVTIVNATLAGLLWPREDPLGKRIGTGIDGDGAPVTIVGIAADVPQDGIAAPARPEMYRPLAQHSRFSVDAMSIVIRTDGEPAHLSASVRQAIKDIHPQAPVSSIQPMSAVAARSVAREVIATRSLALFGGLALLLAAIGLHGVMARLVNARRQELGVRMALGAEPGAVRWLVVSHTLRLAGVGLPVGLVASLLASRQLAALRHGASGADPLVLGGASAVLLAVTLLASYAPARRASRIDPLIVMKAE
jgi:predicted permease